VCRVCESVSMCVCVCLGQRRQMADGWCRRGGAGVEVRCVVCVSQCQCFLWGGSNGRRMDTGLHDFQA